MLKDEMLAMLGEAFPLTEREIGRFAEMKVGPMRYRIRRYDAEGLGPVSVMEMRAFCGLMQMTMLMVNPFEVDAPLFSSDRIHAAGKDTLILEMYNTMLSNAFDASGAEAAKAGFARYPESERKPQWYDDITLPATLCKKGKKKDTPAFDELTRRFFGEYLKAVKAAPACNPEAKKAAARVYTEGLLSHGGPATDVFMQKIGREETSELFRNVLFGTE